LKRNLRSDQVLMVAYDMSESRKGAAGRELIHQLTDSSTLGATPLALSRLEVLLTDYLACLVSASRSAPKAHSLLADDGVVGLGAWLALRSSSEDRDDFDWSAGTHPGSVIWSSIFAIAMHRPEIRKNFLSAALSGYRTSASTAHFLGTDHRALWHVTATAGTFGAASAASLGLGLTADAHQRALHLAGANMGGSSQAPREREGAAGFNRAAATSLGLTAAMAAHDGARAIDNLWNGSRGVLELFSGAGNESNQDLIRDGISTAGLRLFPTNGFVQSAVLATAQLAARNSDQLQSLEVRIATNAASWVDGSRGGRWWDLRSAVASAWVSKDPSILVPAEEIEKQVTVTPMQIPMGGAIVVVKTAHGRDQIDISSPPGLNFDFPGERAWRELKWSKMAGKSFHQIKDISQALIHNGKSPKIWDEIKAMVKD
jgi:hypothetical protein